MTSPNSRRRTATTNLPRSILSRSRCSFRKKNGWALCSRFQIRGQSKDRLEFPGPEASAAVMEETLNSGYRLMVAVAADIALAHRRFKHREEDVGLLRCRVNRGGGRHGQPSDRTHR